MIPYSKRKKKKEIWSFNQFVGQEQTDMRFLLQGTGRLQTSESSPSTGFVSSVQKPEAVVHAMKVHTFPHVINPNRMYLNIEKQLYRAF